MQEKKNFCILVNVDLLLCEKGYEDLRDFVSKLDSKDVEDFYDFDYDLIDTNQIILHPHSFNVDDANFFWLTEQIRNGYILISLDNLKKMLSI